MAVKYFRNDAGEYIRHDDGDYMRDEDCCCCDCETDGPTAAFSYEQTDENPCTFDFTDESVAGSCGEIVSWEWDFGDGGTSSSQNPSKAYSGTDPSDGPWDVTLTVTDSAGCQDSVVMAVACQVPAACCADTPIPNKVTVSSSGWSSDTCNMGGDCAPFSGAHECNFIGSFGGGHEYHSANLGTECSGLGGAFRIEVVICATGSNILQVAFRTSGISFYVYRNITFTDCRGTHELTFDHASPVALDHCNRPANCMLTI